jgi:hypothetical protein
MREDEDMMDEGQESHSHACNDLVPQGNENASKVKRFALNLADSTSDFSNCNTSPFQKSFQLLP